MKESYEHVLQTHDIMLSGQMHSTTINLEGSALSKSYSLVTPLEGPDKDTLCFTTQCKLALAGFSVSEGISLP